MARDIEVNGVTYSNVEAVALQDSEGNTNVYYPDAVRYVAQELTEAQQAQARANIGIIGTVTSGVYFGSDTPPDDANVWIDPSGEASTDEIVNAVIAALPKYNGEVVAV